MNDNVAAAEEQGPAELGVWLFVLGDLTVFALLFGSYAWDFRRDTPLFLQGQAALDEGFGVINTLLLLSGSLFVVMALHRARRGAAPSVSRWLALGMATGVLFFLNKLMEYREQVHLGNTLVSNDFFMYYYMLTGIHLAHVCVGLGVLAFLWLRCRQQSCGQNEDQTYSQADLRNFESGAAIWHMVDLLWIALFPLLYLIK